MLFTYLNIRIQEFPAERVAFRRNLVLSGHAVQCGRQLPVFALQSRPVVPTRP
jgi:hypothetical protein